MSEVPRIPYDEVSEIDMDDLRELSTVEIESHFEAIAGKATGAQLREFLYGDAVKGSDEGKEGLERAYVRRRMETVKAMGDLKRSLNRLFNIDG